MKKIAYKHIIGFEVQNEIKIKCNTYRRINPQNDQNTIPIVLDDY